MDPEESAATAAKLAPPMATLPPLPTTFIRRTAEPITIDGRLDEPVWQRAEPLRLTRVEDGLPTRFATVVRLLWDERYLYAAFACEDPDIWGTFTERDAHIYDEEVVEVFLDDDSDGVSYLEFEVSPRNVVLDLMVLTRAERTKLLWAWDCEGLQTAVHVDGTLDNREDVDRGWSVEIAIPWSEIFQAPNVPPKHGDRWRINLYRIDRARDADEYSAWSPTGAIDYNRPWRFGHAVFSTETV
jgi:Carbohydrate family 9 binding domain-like